MRRLAKLLFLIFLVWNGTTCQVAFAEGENSYTTDISDQVNLTEVRSLLEQIDRDVQESMPQFSLINMFDNLRQGNINLNPIEIGRDLLEALGREVLKSGPLIGQLLLLAVFTAVLQQLQTAFNGSIGKMAQALSYLVLMGIALAIFKSSMDLAIEAIQKMTSFMQTLLPVMMTLLTAMGNLTTAALFKPVVIGSLTVLATLIQTIVLPLFFLAAVLKLFNNISSDFKLGKLAGLFEFTGKVSIGIVMTIFIGVMAVQGVTGGVADGVIFRTAKYSADLIPVVGKFFKDAVELVITSGLLLKNALGIVALIAIVLLCLSPIVKIVALVLVLKISSALIEPMGQTALANSLQDMSKSLIYMFVSVACVGVMFFMTIAFIVGSGNLTVMLR